jgi:hypothetical protein
MTFNIEDIIEYHNNFIKGLKKAVETTLDTFEKESKDNIKNTNKFGGTVLKNSTQSEKIEEGITITMPSKIAVIMEEGSKRHDIVPRRKKYLYFEGEKGPVFTKYVDHPGTKPTHFFTEACDSASENIEPNLETEIDKVIT